MHKTSPGKDGTKQLNIQIVIPSGSGFIYCELQMLDSIGIGMIDQCGMVLMVVWNVLLVHKYNRGCVVGACDEGLAPGGGSGGESGTRVTPSSPP